MKKRFITKTKKKKSYNLFLILILLLIISYKKIEDYNININNKSLIKILLTSSNHHNKFKKNILNKKINIKVSSIIDNNYKNLTTKTDYKVHKTTNIVKEPLIYIYNTHQLEEYKSAGYTGINPTVTVVDYILEDYFNKNNLKTIVEERSIKEILKSNNWKYMYSYKASRILMEDTYKNNPSIKYFIDVHRDSLSKDKTTISINNKKYAKIVFIVGLEHKNYKENLNFTTKINNILNKNYPGLSKGIYKKGGEGVNGIYNQDFSKNTILIEIGGKDNTVEEVLNTSLAFSKCFKEVINNEN